MKLRHIKTGETDKTKRISSKANSSSTYHFISLNVLSCFVLFSLPLQKYKNCVIGNA